MNSVKVIATAVLLGSLLGSAAYAAPRAGGFGGKGPVKSAPFHKTTKAKAKSKKKKSGRKMAHSRKSVKPRIGRPGTAVVQN